MPDAVVCVVGWWAACGRYPRAGALLQYINAQQRRPVVVVAVEKTADAASYAAAIAVSGNKPIALTTGGVTFITESLGVLHARCAHAVWPAKRALACHDGDKQAAAAAIACADDFRLLVEALCGAGLALAYGPDELCSAVPELKNAS